jgi:hypothetical protein
MSLRILAVPIVALVAVISWVAYELANLPWQRLYR